jgi:hypothetical protein
MAGKHGWNTLENYLHVVLRVVQADPFVICHSLEIEISPEAGEISGDIICHGDITVDVTKHFEIRAVGNRKEARTVRYAYHARYRNGDDILRYDNAHTYPGYRTPHHKHEYGPSGDTISHIGMQWPHLSEVLDELKAMVWGQPAG